MPKLRVYQLARELNRDNSEIIRELQHMGVPVTSHSNTVEDRLADQLRSKLGVYGGDAVVAVESPEEEFVEVAAEPRIEEQPAAVIEEPKVAEPPRIQAQPQAPAEATATPEPKIETRPEPKVEVKPAPEAPIAPPAPAPPPPAPP